MRLALRADWQDAEVGEFTDNCPVREIILRIGAA